MPNNIEKSDYREKITNKKVIGNIYRKYENAVDVNFSNIEAAFCYRNVFIAIRKIVIGY